MAGNKLQLMIRATNGAPWETDHFGPMHKVHSVLKAAVKHFVDQGAMSDGDYALALVIGGRAAELPDSQSLEESSVVDGSQLAIIARGPQVDGCDARI